MPENLQKIELLLQAINHKLTTQSEQIQSLREQVNQLVLESSGYSQSVVIEPECDYEWIGLCIQLDSDTWSRIKLGEFVSIKGVGWTPDTSSSPNQEDENFYWDHWEFNGGINKPMKVTMESPRGDDIDFVDLEDKIAYEGPLLKGFIF